MLDLILTFMFFAILGYIIEVIYVFLGEKKWINRGFLIGPYIPIYAFGSILAILLLTKYYDDFIIIFFMGMIITSALEYYTSYVMELIFNRRWWDYSNHKYNINGRITLKNSFLFGIGCLLIIYLINPLLINGLNNLNFLIKLIISIIFILILFTDLIFSSIHAFVTNKNIKDLNMIKGKLNLSQNKYLINIKTRILKAYPYLIKNNEELIEKITKLKKKK